MGQIWSKRHQNQHHHHHHHLRPQPYPPQPPPPPPPQVPHPLPSSAQPPLPPSYAFAANAPHPALPNSPHPPPAAPQQPPPPPPPSYAPHQYPTSSSYYSYNYNYSNFSRPVNMMGPHPNFHNPYYVGHGNGWFRPPVMLLPPPPQLLPLPEPAPYVDHQSAKKIKIDVNVHKDTIRLEVDEANNDSHLVSFTIDAMVDGRY